MNELADRLDFDAALVGLAGGERPVVEDDDVAVVGAMVAIVNVERAALPCRAGNSGLSFFISVRPPRSIPMWRPALISNPPGLGGSSTRRGASTGSPGRDASAV